MAIVNEIKCARCDRKYSGVRSRCPYCGARRIGRGKYSEESDNAKGKMIIGVLIMAVFAVAAAILLFSTPGDAPVTPSPTPVISNPDDDVNSQIGFEPPPPPSPTIEPPPTPPPEPIRSITVYLGASNREWNNESFTLSSSDPTAQFQFTIEPPGFERGSDFKIQLISNNEDFATIEDVVIGQTGRYGFKVSRVARGSTRVRIVITNNGEDIEVWSRPVHVR